MKVEPVAYLVDVGNEVQQLQHHFPGITPRKPHTPLYAIPPGYALVRVEQVKDAERLDFLDGNLKFSMGWQVNKAPVGNVGVHSIIFAGRLPVTIREAIDKAMLTAAKGE